MLTGKDFDHCKSACTRQSAYYIYRCLIQKYEYIESRGNNLVLHNNNG